MTQADREDCDVAQKEVVGKGNEKDLFGAEADGQRMKNFAGELSQPVSKKSMQLDVAVAGERHQGRLAVECLQCSEGPNGEVNRVGYPNQDQPRLRHLG